MGLFNKHNNKSFIRPNRKLSHSEACDRSQFLLAESKRLADIVNETSEPAIFFKSYNLIIKNLQELASYEWFVSFINPPSENLKRIQDQKQDSIHAMIDRCAKRLSDSCRKAYTSEQCRQLIESFEDSFNDFAIDMSEDNIKYMQECADENYNQYIFNMILEKNNACLKQVEEKIVMQKKIEELEKKKERYKQLNAQRKGDLLQVVAEKDNQKSLHLQAHIAARRSLTQDMSESELHQAIVSFISKCIFLSDKQLADEFPLFTQEERISLLNYLQSLHILEPTAEKGRYRVCENSLDFHQLVLKNPTVQTDIDSMDGLQFEHYCSDLLREIGFSDITLTPASGDYGVDILAEKDGITYGIQCKCYTDKVGNHAVQEALAGSQFYHRMVAAVLTNNYFTAAAIESAQKMNVLLWDRNWIQQNTKQ